MSVKLSNLYSQLRNMKIVSFLLPFVFLLAKVCAPLSVPPFIANTQNRDFDQYNRWQPRQPLNDAVVFVDIDEASLQKYGQFPWPRNLFGDLVLSMTEAGAAAIALDERADRAAKIFKNAFVASDFLKIHLNHS